MNLTWTTPPTEAEVLALLSVAELKVNLRKAHSVEDGFFGDCIQEAYAYFDGPTGWFNRSILTQTWTLRLPGFLRREWAVARDGRPYERWVATSEIEIPKPPLQSVTRVRYRDVNLDWVTLHDSADSPPVTSDVFHVVPGETYGKIVRLRGQAWPAVGRHPEAVEITFVAGYGDAAAVKEQARGIVHALKLLASDFATNREATYAEPRLVAVNRKLIYGIEKAGGNYRLPPDHT
ncbi:MAG: hypothetical protein KIS96_11650 [Bauldia sp.]|nr:hypothetical protein [Bauldia sp.]MCW5777495.1 hypothetical protein [Phycisphaeraceae bacterium]